MEPNNFWLKQTCYFWKTLYHPEREGWRVYRSALQAASVVRNSAIKSVTVPSYLICSMIFQPQIS